MKETEGGAKGFIQEIFYSIQGEGLWAGRLQHFIRFKGCSIRCSYCDTPQAKFHEDELQHQPFLPGLENSIEPAGVVEILRNQAGQRPGAHSFAVTGGEPLEQVDFLAALVTEIKEAFPGIPVMLETAGIHFEPMRRVADIPDLVSMDFKLPSTSGLHGMRSQHASFMDALQGCPFYVKTVVDPRTPHHEVLEAAKTVAACDPKTPFFLQPVMREGRIWGGIYLFDLWATAREALEDVRILPQIHRSLSLV